MVGCYLYLCGRPVTLIVHAMQVRLSGHIQCWGTVMVMFNCDLYKAAKALWYVLILLYKTLILGWIVTLTGTLDLVKDRNVLYKCTAVKHVSVLTIKHRCSPQCCHETFTVVNYFFLYMLRLQWREKFWAAQVVNRCTWCRKQELVRINFYFQSQSGI